MNTVSHQRITDAEALDMLQNMSTPELMARADADANLAKLPDDEALPILARAIELKDNVAYFHNFPDKLKSFSVRIHVV